LKADENPDFFFEGQGRLYTPPGGFLSENLIDSSRRGHPE
jgi:hypothetical protein